jgi:glutaredoxin
MRVTLYTKPDCPLCDELRADLLALQPEIGFALIEQNIEEDEDDFASFRYLIPVVNIENGPLLTPPHDFMLLRRTLEATRD